MLGAVNCVGLFSFFFFLLYLLCLCIGVDFCQNGIVTIVLTSQSAVVDCFVLVWVAKPASMMYNCPYFRGSLGLGCTRFGVYEICGKAVV